MTGRPMKFVPSITVPVFADDIARVEDFCERYRAKKPLPISPAHKEVEKDYQFSGKLAECVTGRLLDLPVDWAVYAGRDEPDLVLRDGRTLGVRGVGVKFNMDHDYSLLWREGEHITNYLALGLVTPRRTHVWLAGYVDWPTFAAHATLRTDWAEHGDEQPLGVFRSLLKAFQDIVDGEASLWGPE